VRRDRATWTAIRCEHLLPYGCAQPFHAAPQPLCGAVCPFTFYGARSPFKSQQRVLSAGARPHPNSPDNRNRVRLRGLSQRSVKVLLKFC
jgi:hypothetical protein